MDKPLGKNWEISSDPNFFSPNGTGNSLTYTFKNINTEEYDICTIISYESKEDVQLTVTYIAKTKTNELFDVTLIKSDDDSVEFCIRDFVYSVEKNFSVSLKIEGMKYWNESGFILTDFKPKMQPIVLKNKPFINMRNRRNTTFDDSWKMIPKKLFPLESDNQSLIIKFESIKFLRDLFTNFLRIKLRF